MTIRSPQPDLFAAEPPRLPDLSREAMEPRARKRLGELLAEARAAQRMPWEGTDEALYETIFPQMCDWLPEEEREPLRAAFRAELERLRRATPG